LADELGVYTTLPGVTDAESEKYSKEFSETDVFGMFTSPVPLDPLTPIIDAIGAKDRLQDINIEAGLHEDGIMDKAEFTRQEFEDLFENMGFAHEQAKYMG
jgi:hypothetical protein